MPYFAQKGGASHPAISARFGQVLDAIVAPYRASAAPNMEFKHRLLGLDASETVHLVEPQNCSFRANNPGAIFVQTDAQQVRLRSTRLNRPRLPTIDCV